MFTAPATGPSDRSRPQAPGQLRWSRLMPMESHQAPSFSANGTTGAFVVAASAGPHGFVCPAQHQQCTCGADRDRWEPAVDSRGSAVSITADRRSRRQRRTAIPWCLRDIQCTFGADIGHLCLERDHLHDGSHRCVRNGNCPGSLCGFGLRHLFGCSAVRGGLCDDHLDEQRWPGSRAHPLRNVQQPKPTDRINLPARPQGDRDGFAGQLRSSTTR